MGQARGFVRSAFRLAYIWRSVYHHTHAPGSCPEGSCATPCPSLSGAVL